MKEKAPQSLVRNRFYIVIVLTMGLMLIFPLSSKAKKPFNSSVPAKINDESIFTKQTKLSPKNAVLAQPAMNFGDVAVIGIHGDTNDQFAWIPLVDLPAGTQLFFTDSSWNTSVPNGFHLTEGVLRYTAPAGGVSAGTVQLVNVEAGNIPTNYADAGDNAIINTGGMGISAFGDQVAVFTGSLASPNFLFAANSNSNQWVCVMAGSTATTSCLYSGLINGTNAVAVGSGPNVGDENDNAYYTGPTSGSAIALLLAIADNSNWTGSDTPVDITNGVTMFNVMGPTAAGANISGRVVSAKGRGLGRVSVSVTGGNLTQPRYTQTNPFGYYRFKDLEAGQSYVVSVRAKNYQFVNPTRLVNLEQDIVLPVFVSQK